MAADTISKLTTEIQSTVNEALNYMESSVGEVQTNVKIVSEASLTFESLYEKVDETSHRVEQMIALVGKVDDISKQMEEISKSQVQAADQMVQSTEELNQQTRNVTVGSNTVAGSAEELKREAIELRDKMRRFIV